MNRQKNIAKQTTTIITYYGKNDLTNVKEFQTRMQRILQESGMLYKEYICLYESPFFALDTNTDRRSHICANFLYDQPTCDITISYKKETNELYAYSNSDCTLFEKIAYGTAVLYEQYASEYGLAAKNDCVYDAKQEIGWLNYLFDTQYTNERMMYSPHLDVKQQLKYMPPQDLNFIDIENPTSEQCKMIYLAKKVCKVLKSLQLDTYEQESLIDTIQTMLKTPDRLHKYEHTEWQMVALAMSVLPVEWFLQCVSYTWSISIAELYHMYKSYQPIPHIVCEPIQKCPTKSFLNTKTQWFRCHMNTFKQHTQVYEQLLQFQKEFKELKQNKQIMKIGEDLSISFIHTLHEIQKQFTYVYPFSATVYEFLTASENLEVRAAITLLQRYFERNDTNCESQLSLLLCLYENLPVRYEIFEF